MKMKTIEFVIPKITISQKSVVITMLIALSLISIAAYVIFMNLNLALAYNDARSHLDIGRRVVEGLKPGLAQLGSVWLPLTHLLMVLTIWNDFMWHSGLAGSILSMIAYVLTGLLIYKFLKMLKVQMLGRLLGVAVFALNLNILYLQATAMTELVLIATMTGAAYYLVKWSNSEELLDLMACAFLIMLSTLVRYDGWFLLFLASVLIGIKTYKKYGYAATEGSFIFFSTLAGLGIVLWLLWNQLIFKDALYFAFGPYSAHSQQNQLEAAGNLLTKHNWWLSLKHYTLAMIFNTGAFPTFLGMIGLIALWFDRKITKSTRLMSLIIVAPLLFNILALYLGHSVLFIQGLSGNSWFNVRYGVMMVPSFAIAIGYLINRFKEVRWPAMILLIFVTIFQFTSVDAVTIDDARVGSSQKNVGEVSGWLNKHAQNQAGFVLISAASHDAIIFSSGLPMKRFIHEGTGAYWDMAMKNPSKWARWIIMRTHDLNDSTFAGVSKTNDLQYYNLVGKYPFADIYVIKDEYIGGLITQPISLEHK